MVLTKQIEKETNNNKKKKTIVMSTNEFNTKTIIIYILGGLRISAAVKSCCRLQLQPSGIQMS